MYLPQPPSAYIYIPNLSFILRNYSICFHPCITDILMWMWCGHSVNAFIHAGYSLSNRGEEHDGQHGQQDGKMASPYKPKRQPCKPPFKSKRQPRASPVSLRIIHSSHTRENTFASNIFHLMKISLVLCQKVIKSKGCKKREDCRHQRQQLKMWSRCCQGARKRALYATVFQYPGFKPRSQI